MTVNIRLQKMMIKGFDIFVILVASFACIEIPVLFAFNIPVRGWVLAFEILVFLVFVFDIVRNLFFVHDLSARWHSDKKPFLVYLKGWFWIDLVAAIPFTLILACFVPADGQPHILSILYLLRAIKFLRVMQLVRKVAQLLALNPSVMRLALMFVWVLVIAHYIACFWSYLGY